MTNDIANNLMLAAAKMERLRLLNELMDRFPLGQAPQEVLEFIEEESNVEK